MKTTLRLKIADIIIEFQSVAPLESYSFEDRLNRLEDRFTCFYYSGNRPPDIRIQVHVVKKLPQVVSGKTLFTTYHTDDAKENWRLKKEGAGYLFLCPLAGKKQHIVINKNLKKIDAFVVSKHRTFLSWDVADLIYDFLQILLISYCAKYQLGVFVHSAAICDIDGKGFLCAGESGAGKSTIARIWRSQHKGTIINDDRVIIRKTLQGYMLYNCPWHGELGTQRIEHAPQALMRSLFFLAHAHKNKAVKLLQHEAFCLLYPSLFVTFWNQEWLGHIIDYAQDIVRNVDCRRLSFVNNARVIPFIRSLC